MQNDFNDVIKKLDSGELWDFPGGVFPSERKTLSNTIPIAKLNVPERLYIPVKQHIGVEGQLIVEVGQKVLKGQALTKSTHPFSVPIHAPTSGEIVAINQHVSAHPSGLPQLTVELVSDQHDKWTALNPLMDYQNQPKAQVLSAICHAGISGMGGAGFPAHIKSSPQKEVEFLIINGIECEPYITSDDRLMREYAWQVRQGIDILCHLLTPKHVLIGIESNKSEAIEAMQVACRENANYRICSIPTKYPAGGEKQLIQTLTNREVPAQGLPIDVGVIMHNVGTCFAISDAIFAGKPLIERVVTITGEAVEKPGNVWALIGSPIQHLLSFGDYKKKTQSQPNIIMGGPMMGFSVSSDLVPVVKTTNCILAPTDKEIAGNNEQACIRCSACADACPVSLLPQQIFWHAKAKELEKAQEYNLADCIECGACAYVCPSEIPLVHYYRIAKSEIRAEQEEKEKSDKARIRFEKREMRLIAEQQARDEKHRLAAKARQEAMASNGNNAKDKIAAALARAKAKKQAAQPLDEQPKEHVEEASNNEAVQTDNIKEKATPSKSASSNQRVQAAIARAKAKKAAAEEATIAPQQRSKDDKVEVEVEVEAGAVNAEEVEVESKAEETKQEPINETKVEPSPQASNEVEAEIEAKMTQNITPEAITQSQKQVPSATDSKQARIAAAVAKAKAKREAQKALKNQETIEQTPSVKVESTEFHSPEKTEEQQIDMKKRRIAAAVAKAKAKKAAEKEANAKKDNPS